MHGEHRGGMRGTGRKELDTVLPELPTTILKRPLKPDFDHQMKKLDD